jgi:hypothetical protein
MDDAMREWRYTEHTIRAALVVVGNMRREAEDAAAAVFSLSAVARYPGEQGAAARAADAARAASRCASSAEAHYTEAVRLWYTCPSHYYYESDAGRYVSYALTRAWSDMVAARGAANAADAAATEADMFSA